MKCRNCESDRIIDFTGKTSDLCAVDYKGQSYQGECPRDIGIGEGDYTKMVYCLNCGMMQGDFPYGDPAFFMEENDEEC